MPETNVEFERDLKLNLRNNISIELQSKREKLQTLYDKLQIGEHGSEELNIQAGQLQTEITKLAAKLKKLDSETD
ncbi:MAG TPA: hypothetical protein VF974_05390 [Patescibacteria group bacterium]